MRRKIKKGNPRIGLAGVLTPEEKRICSILKAANPAAVRWDDWQWQLRHRIRTKSVLAKLIHLSAEEEAGIDKAGRKLTMAITPYFASLMDPDDPGCPIRRQCVPTIREFVPAKEEKMIDARRKEKYSPVPGLVHRYPERVLFLVNEMCAMYCRYCTRSRLSGEGHRLLSISTYNTAFDYIRSNKKIREVLISGGDPLLLGDILLEYIIKNVRAVSHVKFVRIGTRVPVALPQRITPNLTAMLRKYGPLWMNINVIHPREITARVKAACNLLADSGIRLESQTVFLKGINDTPAVMKKLIRELLRIHVRPSAIYPIDPIAGSRHFHTSGVTGKEILGKMRNLTIGYAAPWS